MLQGVWGKKIGMTQVFNDKDVVVPVTVIDVARWVVTQIKTIEKDGYSALQLGTVRPRYVGQSFSAEWLKKLNTYFTFVREVKLADSSATFEIGQEIDPVSVFADGAFVDVFGISKGKGFQGGVKRHGFAGGRASHGQKLGRRPGSLSFMRARGRVMKNKRLPGHMGATAVVSKHLQVVKIDPRAGLILVKGSVVGHPGALVYLQKVQGDL